MGGGDETQYDEGGSVAIGTSANAKRAPVGVPVSRLASLSCRVDQLATLNGVCCVTGWGFDAGCGMVGAFARGWALS